MKLRPLLAATTLVAITTCSSACERAREGGTTETAEKSKAAPTAAPTAAPAATPTPPGSPELGKPAPDFTLSDTTDKSYRLSDLRGKTVVLEWFNPDCPFVKYAHGKGPLVDMASKFESPNLVWLSINSSAPGKQGNGKQRNVEAKQEYHMTNAVLLDETGSVGHTYGAVKTPHVFVIDPAGNLVYRGGLDNAPIGTPDDARPHPADAKPGELVPYLSNALTDLQAGRAIALADTPPYGCSVKYAD